jgi:serine/threonine protein kinase
MAHQVTSTETLFWRATIEMMTSDTLPKGTILSDRYRIDAFLAEGGMALVYRAHDLRLERDVALKIVKDDFANSPDYQAAFINEAKLAAKVNHPNLVNVFDQGVDGDFDYLVMELVEGKTLREILTKFGKIESNRALDVIAAVLAGLSALHRAGIIHRDVKPENIILANDGRIKVTDFGLARPASMAQSAAAPLLGTVAYISPEALRGQSVDARSDLYAVGIVLFELLTGEQPFNAEDSRAVARMHLQERVPAPSSLNPAVSTEVDALVLKSTSQSADARFDSASSMLAEVKRAVSHGGDSNQTRVISNETELIDNRTELISAGDLDELDAEPKRERRFRNWLVLDPLGSPARAGARLVVRRRARSRDYRPKPRRHDRERSGKCHRVAADSGDDQGRKQRRPDWNRHTHRPSFGIADPARRNTHGLSLDWSKTEQGARAQG